MKQERSIKHMSGMLYIDSDETDIEKKNNQFINYIRNINKIYIIQCYNKIIFNITEEPHYISSRIPTVFINGQYESRCYVNSSFKVLFFDIFFIQLIMNINCD